MLTFHRSERFTHFNSIDSLRDWASFYVAYERSCQEGCSLGSLASEIIKTDLDVRTDLANAFEQWRDIFRDGLERMQMLGRISADADPTQLTHLLLAAFQGGHAPGPGRPRHHPTEGRPTGSHRPRVDIREAMSAAADAAQSNNPASARHCSSSSWSSWVPIT